MTSIKNIPLLVKWLCELPEETEWVELKANHADPIQLGKNISLLQMQRPLLEDHTVI